MHSSKVLSAFVLIFFASQASSQEALRPADAACTGINFGILPHPTDCQLYYVCVSSKGSVYRCGYNFVFDPRVSFCVHRSMYQCPGEEGSTSAPSTTEPPSNTDTPEPPTTPSNCPETSWESLFCQDRVSNLIRNPFNCTQFINCGNAAPNNRECPPGKVFSLPYQDCFPGDTARCSLQPLDPSFCQARPDGNYPHPYRCNQFVTCFQRVPRVESCPPYYVLDQQTMRCVKGSVLSCSSLLAEV